MTPGLLIGPINSWQRGRMVRCSKGHESPDDHAFCGTCGERLGQYPAGEEATNPVPASPSVSRRPSAAPRAGSQRTPESPGNSEEKQKPTPGWNPDPANPGQLRWWNGTEWTAHVYHEDEKMPQDKSVGVAFVLTFFFNAFGLLYVSVPIALVALVINFVVFVVTLGFGLILTWPANVILCCILASRRHSEYQAWLAGRLADGGSTSPRAASPQSAQTAWAQDSPTRAAKPDETGSPLSAQMSGPPGWRPDPTGRFEVRWWNGNEWTTHVAIGRQQMTDPAGAK